MATEAPLIMTPSYHQPHRPNSLLIPPNPAYLPGSPRGGILMNRVASPMTASSSVSGLWPGSGTYTPRSPSPLSASLSPDSAPADRNSSIGSRKIRFAPLPEPRRDVMVDEDGTETPCSSAYPPDATSFPVQSPSGGTSVTLDRTDSLMTDSGASTTSTEADTQSQTSRKREKRSSLLRIFGMKGSSTPKRTSTSSLPTDGISGLGLSLFRTSSRESWSGELSGYTSDNSASRRMSSPLRTEFRSRPTTPNYGSYGAPLMQPSSDGSGSIQRPQRMLNGRVYGARRAKERLQPQASMEPEFSEWGYGGMGSVGTSGEYGKLQSSSSAVGGGDDDDDGSGMTWIRKRKEKREREEREKKAAEEAAAAEAAKKAAEEPAESSAEPRGSTETSNSTPTIQAESAEVAIDPKTPTRETHNAVPSSPSTTRPPSRTNSAPLSPPRTPAIRNIANPPSRQDSGATVTPERHVPTVISVPAHRGRQDGTVLGNGVAMSPETSPERSSGSSSRSSSSDDEENAEDSSSTTGRDEDEDEEEENQKRKTALSAGIEKISRHHA
ncbi:hypothetical protein FRC09_007200 [Ceratobasidium sp. 395]|nr:hypothetical protein FRC09_007200 [Ceratobasidium sp. 395]